MVSSQSLNFNLAASEIATTAGCFSLRSKEIAKKFHNHVLLITVLYGLKKRAGLGAFERGRNQPPRSKAPRYLAKVSEALPPSFAKATEGSPHLHPRSKLRGIRRRRINGYFF